MTKSRCVKGWNEIGGGRALRTTSNHHLYVIRTMGGRFVAEVLKKHQSIAEAVRIFWFSTTVRIGRWRMVRSPLWWWRGRFWRNGPVRRWAATPCANV